LYENRHESECGDDALSREEVEDEFEGNAGDEDHGNSSKEGSRSLNQRGHLGHTALLLDVVADIDSYYRSNDVVRTSNAIADEEHSHIVLPSYVSQGKRYNKHNY
jgi:hypothetical protein